MLDTALHRLGLELLDEHRTDFKANNKLQELPYIPPIKVRGQAKGGGRGGSSCHTYRPSR